jgi:hypothetical protein
MKIFFSTVFLFIAFGVNAQSNSNGTSAPVLKTTDKSAISPSDSVSVNSKTPVLSPYDTNNNAPGAGANSQNAPPELVPYKKEERPK